jgi:hypothetical protein
LSISLFSSLSRLLPPSFLFSIIRLSSLLYFLPYLSLCCIDFFLTSVLSIFPSFLYYFSSLLPLPLHYKFIYIPSLHWTQGSRVQTRPKTMDFKGDKIRSTPSFGGEVKPSVPCRSFTACKRTLRARQVLNS